MAEKRPAILVVDDEAAIRRYLKAVLTSEAYEVVEARDGAEALLIAPVAKPDLIILDLGLPDMDGVEVTHDLRQWSETPILILSVRENEKEKVAALDAGADDYLTKPFGTSELLARLRVALRRTARTVSPAPVFQTGALVVDQDRRFVSVEAQEVSLTPNEYDLLSWLVRNAGKVLTHRFLLEKVWGIEYSRETHLLRVNISNLRRKIEKDPTRPEYIITESGVGYRLKI